MVRAVENSFATSTRSLKSMLIRQEAEEADMVEDLLTQRSNMIVVASIVLKNIKMLIKKPSVVFWQFVVDAFAFALLP